MTTTDTASDTRTAPLSHAPTPGTSLWVHAHPQQGSLNDQLFRAGAAALAHRGEVLTSDLYPQGFDPVLRTEDAGHLAADPGNLSLRISAAHAAGRIPAQVLQEQRKLAAAELLVLQFPLWWYGMPAILKGWLDRVLTDGFAYGDMDRELGVPRRYGDGGLTGRRALVIVTAGEDAASIGPRGISGDIESLMFPLTHGALWYVGIDVLDIHLVTDADGLDADGVAREVDRLRARIEGIDAEAPVPFRTLREGDYRGTRALREDLLPGRHDLGIHRRAVR
ncbi:NAD(P)H-dependent oxidoreductase [Brachybacterium sp. YJGR34]|uniref:NAD(P)H-dependent oxidoreductase n=1 Tax=Brachybacterium sp. YJGR34 TaxID=2059911 RepID=UPI000E0A96D5|nr:NAD(P)H-dependent oxidoreductase [Brachybacterium sp. YJGR34]